MTDEYLRAELRNCQRARDNVQSASDFLAERGSGRGQTVALEFDDLNGVLGAIEIQGIMIKRLEAEIERLRSLVKVDAE